MPRFQPLSEFSFIYTSEGARGVNNPSTFVEVIGKENLIQKFRLLDRNVKQIAVSVAKYAAYRVKLLSQTMVPYDTGFLYESAYVHEDTKDTNNPGFEVGYDASYAWPVHETPKNYQQGTGPYPNTPKTAGFLQIARDRVADEYPNLVEGYLQEALDSVTIPDSTPMLLKPRSMAPRLMRIKGLESPG